MQSSTPNLEEFDPRVIPYQHQVVSDIFENYDYSLGTHEVLLSGSVGSAKSLLMAHVAVMHCLTFPKAVGMLGRRSLPDLKDTILRKILDHMQGSLRENIDYFFNQSNSKLTFSNGSQILCRTWGDKRYSKFRSLELSFAIIEELTENDSDEFDEFYKELRARVGRLPHIKQNFLLCATNPDAPSHSAFNYFIASQIPTRHVYYSITTDNPFLPKTYIQQLLETYTAQEAERMIYGRWVEIKTEVIYYAFDEKMSVIDTYKVNPSHPIFITYDFNIGINKPMSVAFFQYINDVFYFFYEIVISGSNTLETCDEMIAKGLLTYPTRYVIHGDASGRAKSSKYNRTDYDIIKKALDDYIGPHGRIEVDVDVPLSNPPVRKRHIIVNGQLKNAKGETHIKITKDCVTIIKGLRLSKLKKGGQYIEDDSDPWQHITTAIGYGICRQIENKEIGTGFYQRSIHGNEINPRERYPQSGFSQKSYRRN